MKRSVYVAGFERGVRPIGDWSMSITLSKHSIPSQLRCSPGLHPHLVQPVGERLEDDLVDERRLAGAGDAGHADELPDRELDVDVLQVVLRGAAHPERAEVFLAPLRHRDPARSGEELARHRRAVRARPSPPAPRRRRGRRARPRPAPCRRASRPSASSARRARRRRPCCRGRAAGRASRSAGRCRAGAARSTARRGCRARRRAASRSASPAAAAAPRRPTASPMRGRGSGSRPRRRRGTSAARGSP